MNIRNIATINGSLRRRSYNGMALGAAAGLAPPHLHFAPVAFDDVPIYNQDVQDTGFPPAVLRVAEQLRQSQGILIASPEYNHSIAGPLKNLIDWLSRLPEQPFRHAPVALLSVTTGPFGGARHQHELRKVLGSLEAFVLHKPEIHIGMGRTRFAEDGQLLDAPTGQLLQQQMVAFDQWITRLRP